MERLQGRMLGERENAGDPPRRPQKKIARRTQAQVGPLSQKFVAHGIEKNRKDKNPKSDATQGREKRMFQILEKNEKEGKQKQKNR